MPARNTSALAVGQAYTKSSTVSYNLSSVRNSYNLNTDVPPPLQAEGSISGFQWMDNNLPTETLRSYRSLRGSNLSQALLLECKAELRRIYSECPCRACPADLFNSSAAVFITPAIATATTVTNIQSVIQNGVSPKSFTGPVQNI